MVMPPGAREVANGVDNNCEGTIDTLIMCAATGLFTTLNDAVAESETTKPATGPGSTCGTAWAPETVSDCSFIGNVADTHDDPIELQNAPHLTTFAHLHVEDNDAGHGGGLAVSEAWLHMRHSSGAEGLAVVNFVASCNQGSQAALGEPDRHRRLSVGHRGLR